MLLGVFELAVGEDRGYSWGFSFTINIFPPVGADAYRKLHIYTSFTFYFIKKRQVKKTPCKGIHNNLITTGFSTHKLYETSNKIP